MRFPVKRIRDRSIWRCNPGAFRGHFWKMRAALWQQNAQAYHRPMDTLRAEFNPLIRPYLVVTIGFVMMTTIIGIPIALIWFLGLGQWWARHYFDKLECEMSDKRLRYRKGIIFQIEKTIPLENIQDVTFIEGPLLKQFHLATVKFETAGQSAGQAHDMQLTGIIDAHEFRAAILSRRDTLKESQRTPTALASGPPAEMLATLKSIEKQLAELVALARDKSK
jgi:putative membrane protein